jgi:Na+-translocating ferredoxin:NAD+ oxidoreductase subunit G
MSSDVKTVAVDTDAAASQGPDDGASSFRIVATLSIAGLLAGILLIFVYQATQPAILAHKAEMLRLAVSDVLQEPASYDTLYLVDGKLSDALPDGALEKDFEKVFLGRDANGAAVGFAVVHNRAGFQDQVKIIFGYDPRTKRMMGMKVLESKETPGLGDAIEKNMDFVEQFTRTEAPLVGVKPGSGSGSINEIDMITGATISSKAVIKIINEAYERWQPMLQAYLKEAGQ